MDAERRRLLVGAAAAFVGTITPNISLSKGADAGDSVGAPLSPWRPGHLEIHHISTGRGNCTLLIGPDGSSLMIDAGATADSLDVSTAPRPNGSLRPGQWIARYARRRLPSFNQRLNGFLASHLHPDHIGAVTADSPSAPGGGYRLTGVTDVAQELPIDVLFDRGWPTYDYPSPQQARFATNYIAFARSRDKLGLRNERIEAGRADQVRLSRATSGTGGTEVRILACSGRVWTGRGTESAATFPDLACLMTADWPQENMCSVGLRVAYAGFRYFTAGDLTANTFDGALPWADIEGATARACGAVNVAAACHHGYFDAVGASCVRELRPAAWIIPAWHITHPGMKPLERMFSDKYYSGPRDVFLTQVMPQALTVNWRFLESAKSTSGHVVVRVYPTGSYQIAVTDSWREDDRVLMRFGPYEASEQRAQSVGIAHPEYVCR